MQLTKQMARDPSFKRKLPPKVCHVFAFFYRRSPIVSPQKYICSCLSSVFTLQCACGGYFKPDAILFGEGIPSKAVREANKEADACDVMLVVGTSATVHPACDLPYRAMRRGAKVIEVRY